MASTVGKPTVVLWQHFWTFVEASRCSAALARSLDRWRSGQAWFRPRLWRGLVRAGSLRDHWGGLSPAIFGRRCAGRPQRVIGRRSARTPRPTDSPFAETAFGKVRELRRAGSASCRNPRAVARKSSGASDRFRPGADLCCRAIRPQWPARRPAGSIESFWRQARDRPVWEVRPPTPTGYSSGSGDFLASVPRSGGMALL